MGILLSDEETNYQIDYVLKHNDLPLECLLLPLVQSSNKAQLKKVVEYLLSSGSGDLEAWFILTDKGQALLKETE